jgi:hypothetical protein
MHYRRQERKGNERNQADEGQAGERLDGDYCAKDDDRDGDAGGCRGTEEREAFFGDGRHTGVLMPRLR